MRLRKSTVNGPGLGRDRVLALAQHLIDQGYFRADVQEYVDRVRQAQLRATA
jgi:hypothetical protein